MSKMIFFGAADFRNPLEYIKKNVDPKNIIATELRSDNQLEQSYSGFTQNKNTLQNKEAHVYTGVDALALTKLPINNNEAKTLTKADLKEATHIVWNSPYFDKKNEPEFPNRLKTFFEQIDTVCGENPPQVMISMDALGPDGFYNLHTRFGLFDIPGWRVKHMVDLRGHYTFAANDSKGKNETGRVGLSPAQSMVVQGLVLEKIPQEELKAEEKKLNDIKIKNPDKSPQEIKTLQENYRQEHKAKTQAMFFCSGAFNRARPNDEKKPGDGKCDCVEEEKLKPRFYQNIYKLNVISFQDWCKSINNAQFRPKETSFANTYRTYTDKDGITYHLKGNENSSTVEQKEQRSNLYHHGTIRHDQASSLFHRHPNGVTNGVRYFEKYTPSKQGIRKQTTKGGLLKTDPRQQPRQEQKATKTITSRKLNFS